MIRREDQKGDTVTFNPTMAVLDFSAGPLAYDVKGNQTSRSPTRSAPALNLDWNFDNQLRGADTHGSAGSLEVTFEYDALGLRVARSHSSGNVVYVHAGQQVVADDARGAVTSSPTYRYVYADCLCYAGYVDEPILRHTGTTTNLPTTGDNALYYHRNQQYSIVGLTNAAGTLVERYTYSAYGTLGIYAANGTVRTSSTYANRYTYTGREWDADLRLYHFRARWYDPATGGFVTRDPLGYVDGMSLYRGYFGVREVDPSGTISTPSSPTSDDEWIGRQVNGDFGDYIFKRSNGTCYIVSFNWVKGWSEKLDVPCPSKEVRLMAEPLIGPAPGKTDPTTAAKTAWEWHKETQEWDTRIQWGFGNGTL